MTHEEKLEFAIKQLSVALDMLKEVERYRGSFYKQKVANWQAENDKVFNPVKTQKDNDAEARHAYYLQLKTQPYH